MDLEQYWKKFLNEKNLPETTPFGGELTFSNDEKDFSFILALILSGKKTAQFSAFPSYNIDFELLPRKNWYYVLNDWKGNPVGVLKTTNVQILPFGEVTQEMAQKDGEENLNLWRERYSEFFQEDSEIVGYEFNMDMPVVFEEFDLVYKS